MSDKIIEVNQPQQAVQVALSVIATAAAIVGPGHPWWSAGGDKLFAQANKVLSESMKGGDGSKKD